MFDNLSPTMKLIVYGIGEENVAKMKAAIDYVFRDVDGNNHLPDDKLEESLKENSLMLHSMATGAAAAYTTRKLTERFTYVTQPAMAVSAKVMGEYGSLLMQSMGKAEEIKHTYGMIAGGIGSVAASIVTSRIAQRLLSSAKAVKQLNKLRQGIRVARGASSAAKLVATVGTGIVGGVPGLIGAVAAFAASTLAQEVAYKIAVNMVSARAERLSLQEIAPHFFNRQRIVDDYTITRGVMQDVTSGNSYDVFDSILKKRNLSDYNFDYGHMSHMSHSLLTSGRVTEGFEEYMAETMELEFLYGRDMTGTMSNLSMVVFGEVEKAKEAFTQFFSAIAEEPQSSHLRLVDELVAFTSGYSQGQKLNLDTTPHIASIAQFAQPVYNNMQTTAPMQTLVTGIDNVLLQGVAPSNFKVTELMRIAGITSGEALTGVTNDAETFNKFLGGVNTVVGHDDSEEGFIRLYQYLSKQLGMDDNTIQAVIPALEAHRNGRRAEEVHTDYLADMRGERADALADFALTPLISEFSRGARTLSSVVFQNASIMNDLDAAFMRAYGEKTPQIIGSLARLAATVANKIDPGSDYFTPAPLDISPPPALRSPWLAGIGITQGAGLRDTRLDQLSSDSRKFYLTVAALLAGEESFRITGVSGFRYGDPDPRLGNRINVGTDVVIAGAGKVYFPFIRGTVIYVGNRTNTSGELAYGLSVVIRLDGEYSVSFSHLASAYVSVGQVVRRGDLIGRQGESGKVTGSHVDIEYRIGGQMSGTTFKGGEIISQPDRLPSNFNQFLFDNDGDTGYNEVHIEANMGSFDLGDFASYLANSLESLNV